MVETIEQTQKTQTQTKGPSMSMEEWTHNLARYAKYCLCGHTKISISSEFTKETDHSERNFSRHW